jgi:hypothetical protein
MNAIIANAAIAIGYGYGVGAIGGNYQVFAGAAIVPEVGGVAFAGI